MSQPEKITLPWWMSGAELTKIKDAGQQFFDYLKKIVTWPLDQLDVINADIGIVKVIAWQRGITRFIDEPETLFRQRVFDAYANANDAGSVVGITRIAQRLGLGYLELLERQSGKDWDVIIIKVPNTLLSGHQELMNWLIQTYGRTCRRYEWLVITNLFIGLTAVEFAHDQQTLVASLSNDHQPATAIRPGRFAWSQQTVMASLSEEAKAHG